MDSYYLVNVVHNDYKRPDAIFEPFFKAGAEYAARYGSAPPPPTTNGANGHANGNANGHAH